MFRRVGPGRNRSHATGRRSGLTLIELLVVVAVIAVLVGLLFPAVQMAREVARRAACASRLRQIGLALHLYHDTHGSLPLAHASARNAAGEFLQQSWTRQLLPFVEQRNLHDRYDESLGFAQGANRDLLAEPVTLYRCPSSPVPPIDSFDLAGYPTADMKDPRGQIFDAGVAEYFAVSEFVGPSRTKFGSGAGMLPFSTLTRDGCPLQFHEVTDGLSQTIAVAECAGGGQVFRAGGRAAGRRQASALGHWAGRNRLSLWRYDSTGARRLGGDCLVNCTNENGANLYGFHPGGVQVAFGDGSARFLNERTDFDTIARLCVVDDGQVIGDY